jgi:hypothetical protein
MTMSNKRRNTIVGIAGCAVELGHAASAFVWAADMAEIKANANDELTRTRLAEASAEFETAKAKVLELILLLSHAE